MFQVRESKQKGFSLVELGIVLAVVSVALFFTVSKVSETKVTSRALNVSRDLTQIMTNAQRLYSTKGEFPADGTSWNNNAVLIRNNVFPASWVAGNDVVTPFGGAFRIDTQGGYNRKLAAIVLNNIPSKVCAELGQAIMGEVVGMWAGSNEINAPLGKNPATGDINLENLGNGCTQAANVSMAFYFRTN
jgi:prepilin-type N-terminal cleavage/methylation domain-containing protein